MDISDRLAAAFPREADLPEAARLDPVHQTDYLIGGELRHWEGARQEVFSPVCLRDAAGALSPAPLGSYPLLGEAEAMAALSAARAAYDQGRGEWPTLGVAGRIRHVEEFARRLEGEGERLVRLLMWEIGKSRADSEREFRRTLDYIAGTIEAVKELDRASSRFVIDQGIIGQIRRAPLGVALCLGPYNYPLNETFTTLIPALIMGNTVIFKPPRLGVLIHQPLLSAFRDAFPPGVVNTVYGEGEQVIGPLMRSGGIDVLAFIGTSRVADILKRAHPLPHRLRSVLGLEAKNPAIILPDADLDLTVSECLAGALAFNGQRCTALKIIFVHRRLAPEFLERLSAAVTARRCGMPWDEGVFITPLPEPGKIAFLDALVQDALAQGARVVNEGGGSFHETLFHPAVVYPVAPNMRLYREEQFGPVVAVLPFDEVEEPLRYVAESNYGQQVSLFGRDPEAVGALIDPLISQVCRVNLNSLCQRGPDTFPFAGRKDSAEGTVSVSDALRVFSVRAVVAARGLDTNKVLITAVARGRRSSFLSTDFIL